MKNCVQSKGRNPVLILTGLPSCAGKQGAVSVSRQLPPTDLMPQNAFPLVMIMIPIWIGTWFIQILIAIHASIVAQDPICLRGLSYPHKDRKFILIIFLTCVSSNDWMICFPSVGKRKLCPDAKGGVRLRGVTADVAETACTAHTPH